MEKVENSIWSNVGEKPIEAQDVDFSLVQRVKDGDLTAFDALVNKYKKRLFCVVYNIVSNEQDANDLTQEAFIKAFNKIHSFKGNSAFFSWLYKIAVNITLTFVKKNSKRRFLSFQSQTPEFTESEIISEFLDSNSSDKQSTANELKEKLNEALQMLSPKHRTVVVLFEIEGLSHKEIAKIMKTTQGTVRSRLHYAKKILQSKLNKYLQDDENANID